MVTVQLTLQLSFELKFDISVLPLTKSLSQQSLRRSAVVTARLPRQLHPRPAQHSL